MIITDKAQIKAASFKESDKLHLTTSDELECYDLIESDLKLPADATFARSSVAYLSDGTQVDANMPRFEPGRFGKAIMVEEGTTNLLRNPSFETGALSDWTTGFGLGITGNASIVTSPVFHGNYAVKIEITSSTSISDASAKQTINFAAGTTITISAYLLDIQGNVQAELTIRCSDGQGGYQFLRKVFTSPGRCVFTVTIPTGYTADQIWVSIRPKSVGVVGYVIWDAVQLEAKPYATSFIDGTRAAETLTIPTAGVLNPQEGTVEMRLYVNPAHRDPSSVRRFFGHQPGPGNSNRITMQHNNGPYWLFTIGDANGNTHGLTINDSDVADGWRLFTMKWGVSEFAVYVDGIKKAFLLNPTYLPSAVGQKITIYESTNALIDDLRISSIARSDEEILAAYQSGEPLAADEWTTYKLDFDDKVRITTQGQIICNELIEI